MRLAQYMAKAGIASRRACEKIIQNESIFVNNQLIKALHYQVNIEQDIVQYKNKKLIFEKKRYIIINKPTGFICSRNNKKGKKLIYDLIPTQERLFSIGRLDYNSEGLIILTNDGELSQKIAHPSYKIEKKYRVRVNNRVNANQLYQLRTQGIIYKGITYKVKGVNIKASSKKTTTINFILTEGKKHEIRKICAALGLDILILKRVQIAHIRLAQLPIGSYRDLTEQEIKKLKYYVKK